MTPAAVSTRSSSKRRSKGQANTINPPPPAPAILQPPPPCCPALPHAILVSRLTSGDMADIAERHSSHEVASGSPVWIVRVRSCSISAVQTASSAPGIGGRRVQCPLPAHRYGCWVSGWILGGRTSCTVNPFAVPQRSS